MSILQGYDIEIRHIPSKVNPADALTRQVKGDDDAYAETSRNKTKTGCSRLECQIRLPMQRFSVDYSSCIIMQIQGRKRQGTRIKLN